MGAPGLRFPRRRVRLALTLLGFPLALTAFPAREARAQGIADIVCLQRMDEHFLALQSFFNNPETYRFLEARVSAGSIWHINTFVEGEGCRVEILTAGRKRNTSRLSRARFVGSPDPRTPGGFVFSTPEEGFVSKKLEEAPVVRDSRELEIFRAALNDTGVRSTLLSSFKKEGWDVYSATLDQDPGGSLTLMFFSREVTNGSPFVVKYQVRHDAQGWHFQFD